MVASLDRHTTEPVTFVDTLPALAARRDAEFLATEYQLVSSRPVAEQVLHHLNLTGFPPFAGSNDPAQVLLGMVRVTPVRGTKLVDIVVTNTNAKLAMLIANATAQTYAEVNLERRRQQTTGGARWLRDEVNRAEQQMKEAQAALQQFKEEHHMVSLEERQNVIVQRLRELSTAATSAKTARLAAETAQGELERAIAAGTHVETVSVVHQSALVQGLEKDISDKEGRLLEQRKTYGELHPSIVQLIEELEILRQRLRTEAQKVIEGLRVDTEAARRRSAELQQALAEQEQLALELNRLELQYQNLIRQAQFAADLFGSLAKRLKELEVAESMQSNNVRVIDEAKLPPRPISPNRPQFAIQGGILGLLLGVVSAFLSQTLTTTIRMRRDLETLVNLPFLGHVVRLKLPRSRSGPQSLFFTHHPNGVAAEGLRAIRTTLEFLLPETPTHRILVTSSLPDEGKSLVSANLAVSLKELGRRVVALDADMRRPTLYRTFGISLEPGLSNYLQGHIEIEEILQSPASCPGITVIASGPSPSRPADLLAGARFIALLKKLEESFDYVILDTPPVLAVADATILSRVVEGAILVVRANRTTRDTLLGTHRQLSQSPLKFMATVLNDVRPEYDYQYYRRGYHYYGRQESSRTEQVPRRPASPPMGPVSPDVAGPGETETA